MRLSVVTGTLLTLSLAATAWGQATQVATNTPPAKPLWDTSAHLGLTLTRGNSRTLLFAGDVESARKWDQNELNLGADAAYGDDHGVKTAESIHGFGQYNRLFTERFFGYARLEGLHDAIADIDYRITLSPGAGYYFIKTANTGLRGELGPGYVFEQLAGVNHDYATLRVAERFDQKINERAKFWESAEYLPQVDRFSNYVVNFELGIETAITTHLTQRVSLQDSYRNEPAPGRQKNDLKLIAAIGYKF